MTDIIETLPPVLRGLCRGLVGDSTGMPHDLRPLRCEEAQEFREDLAEALENSTADLERVGWYVLLDILERLPMRPPEVWTVIKGIRRLAEGGEWPPEDAARAAAAAADRAQAISKRPEQNPSACAARVAAVAVRAGGDPEEISFFAYLAAARASRDGWATTEARNIMRDILKGIRND